MFVKYPCSFIGTLRNVQRKKDDEKKRVFGLILFLHGSLAIGLSVKTLKVYFKTLILHALFMPTCHGPKPKMISVYFRESDVQLFKQRNTSLYTPVYGCTMIPYINTPDFSESDGRIFYFRLKSKLFSLCATSNVFRNLFGKYKYAGISLSRTTPHVK